MRACGGHPVGSLGRGAPSRLLPCRPAVSSLRRSLSLAPSTPHTEPEHRRPISPGYRLHRERRPIELRKPRPRSGLRELRTSLFEQEKNGEELQYSDLAAMVERAARADDFETAKELLKEIDKRGMKHTSGRALRSVLQAYARCDLMSELEWAAQQLWLHGHQPDVWCYNAWIGALIRRRKIKEAEAKMKEMIDLKLQPTVVTYHALLSGYANNDDKEKVLSILAEMERLGLPWTEYTWTPLIHMYARRGEPSEVRALMERLTSNGTRPTVRIYNSLLSALSKASQFDRMPAVLREMQEQGVLPVTETFNTLIAAHAKLGDFAAASECLHEMRSLDLPLDLLSFAPLIAARCKRGEPEEAEAILKEMKAMKVPPSTSEGMLLVNAWIATGQYDRARGALAKLADSGLVLTRSLYVPLLTAFAEARRFKEASELVSEMRQSNMAIDGWMTRFGAKQASSTSSGAAAGSAATETPDRELGDMAWSVQERTAHIKNLLAAGRRSEAERVLASMEANGPAPNLWTYTLMLGHYGMHEELSKMEEVLQRMQQRGVQLDSKIYEKLMRSYGSQRRAGEVLQYWELAQKQLAKEGKVASAAMYHDAVTAWCLMKEIDKAVALTEEMLSKKVKPLGATFVRLLNALIKADQRQAASEWANRMVDAGYSLMEPLASTIRDVRRELKPPASASPAEEQAPPK